MFCCGHQYSVPETLNLAYSSTGTFRRAPKSKIQVLVLVLRKFSPFAVLQAITGIVQYILVLDAGRLAMMVNVSTICDEVKVSLGT
jgi:hypothetical protein